MSRLCSSLNRSVCLDWLEASSNMANTSVDAYHISSFTAPHEVYLGARNDLFTIVSLFGKLFNPPETCLSEETREGGSKSSEPFKEPQTAH